MKKNNVIRDGEEQDGGSAIRAVQERERERIADRDGQRRKEMMP